MLTNVGVYVSVSFFNKSVIGGLLHISLSGTAATCVIKHQLIASQLRGLYYIEFFAYNSKKKKMLQSRRHIDYVELVTDGAFERCS
jgi:hypothetical protein